MGVLPHLGAILWAAQAAAVQGALSSALPGAFARPLRKPRQAPLPRALLAAAAKPLRHVKASRGAFRESRRMACHGRSPELSGSFWKRS